MTPVESAIPIDISWVYYPYTASTWDVMYCRQRRNLYYGGENLKSVGAETYSSYTVMSFFHFF
jgi:hypothetical protein